MNLIRRNQNQRSKDPFQELFDLDHPFFGFPMLTPKTQGWGVGGDGWAPAVDVSENENEILVKADLPGLRKEDITVSLNDGVLTIKGERKYEDEKKEKNYHRIERAYGVFERSFNVGNSVDAAKIKANYKDGVLDLVLPKTESAQPKQITIN